MFSRICSSFVQALLIKAPCDILRGIIFLERFLNQFSSNRKLAWLEISLTWWNWHHVSRKCLETCLRDMWKQILSLRARVYLYFSYKSVKFHPNHEDLNDKANRYFKCFQVFPITLNLIVTILVQLFPDLGLILSKKLQQC